MEARPEDQRDEQELVNAVRPLLTQAEQILNETQGMIKGADPEGKISSRAKKHAESHQATPEEQRLAQALSVVSAFPITKPSSFTEVEWTVAGQECSGYHRVGERQT